MWEEYFYGFKNHFWDLGLDNLKKFLVNMGNPQNKVKVIHIAGTNGKGSVSAYVSNILIEAGYKVGRYNSPAVFEKWENLTINGKKITGEEFDHLVIKMKPWMDQADREGCLPTVFELETALAYEYFASEQCDFAVVECGLGGSTDATNVTNTTVLSILTSISMDHTAYLGNTLEKIAVCKAGIIKNNIPSVMIAQSNEVTDTVVNQAKEKNSSLRIVDKSRIHVVHADVYGQIFNYSETYKISMPGKYQTENAAVGIEAARILREQGFFISEEAIRRGLEKTVIPGRFEMIQKENPIVFLDGAHNPDAAMRLRETIELLLKDYHIIFIMGVFSDKDYKKVVENTYDLADNIYTVRAEGKRALEPEVLAECIRHAGGSAASFDTVEQAVAQAYKKAEELTSSDGKGSAIISFGSLSYLKYVREAVMKNRRRKNEDK